MSRKRNDCRDAITAVLDDAGIAYTIKQTKHLHILFTINGRERMLVCPVSSGDTKARYHSRAIARRMIREDRL